MSERRLLHGDGKAERFHRALEAPALIGIEACGNSEWLIELAERLGHVVARVTKCSGTQPSWINTPVLTHRPGSALLENAFVLIEGHPS
jgi:hypothetical protein